MQDATITITIPPSTIKYAMNVHGLTYRGAVKALTQSASDMLDTGSEQFDADVEYMMDVDGMWDADDFQDGKGFKV